MIFILLAALFVLWFIGSHVQKVNNLSYFGSSTNEAGTPLTNSNVASVGDALSQVSQTQKFAYDLYETYTAGENADLNAVPEEEVIEKLEELVPSIDYYSFSNLRPMEFTTESESNYATALGTLFANLAHVGFGEENITFMRAVFEAKELQDNTIKVTAYESLKQSSQTYRDLARGMMQLSVPNDRLEAHLTIANAYVDMSYGSDFLAEALFDPIYGVIGTQYIERGIYALNPDEN